MEDQTQKPKKKFYKRWWFWVIVFVVLYIIGSSNMKSNNIQKTEPKNEAQTTQQKTTTQEEAIKVTALKLASDYKANQVAADSKYEGKTVEVTGTITSIGKDILDTPYVTLNGGDIITSVQCMFDKSDQAELATLSKDTRITLQGKVRGGLIMNVLLDNCSIVK